MVTLTEALHANEFHFGTCAKTVGPRGGVTIHCERWRRSGGTKTWKRDVGAYRIPIMHGLRAHGYLTNVNATDFHTAANCPLNAPYVTTGRPPFGTGRDESHNV